MSVTRTPKWAVGMKKIGPGLYVDKENALHLSEREICAQFNVPCTAENLATIERAVRDMFPGVATTTVNHSSKEKSE